MAYNADDYDYENYTDYGAGDYNYDIILYKGFSFERPIYLVIWEVLVVITTLFNCIIISVLTGRGMINSTNIILIAIAISDSLTGLVTMPTFIYVYNNFLPGGEMGSDAYKLTEAWCEAFMLSKFFISRSFHTMSIWLTVFLCFQRFISVWAPFKAHNIFTKVKTIGSICIIGVLSILLHVYHIVNRKTNHGLCVWVLESDCKEGCAYLWIAFLLMHLIPCALLIIFTIMMLSRLFGSAAKMRDMTMASSRSTKRRDEDNKRISFIVICVIVVFLIPEVPYGIYILYTLIRRHSGLNILPLKTNRAFDCAYELLLVLSFHANFWIYTFMNKKFRDGLKRNFYSVTGVFYTFIGKRHSIVPSAESSSYGDRTLVTDVHGRPSIGEELKELRHKEQK